MKIVFSDIKNHGSFTSYKVVTKTNSKKYCGFTIITSAIPDININEDVGGFINDNRILLTVNKKKTAYELKIGSKCVSQLKLGLLGYFIPDTVVLDFSFFEAFKKTNNVDLEIIYNQYIKKDLGHFLAIRSSSNLEDSEGKSYAGAFDTYLEVPNEFVNFRDKIFRSYQKYSSMDNKLPELSKHDLKLGIIVQSMVKPWLSGFLFTMNPMNPPNQLLKIEYWKGEREKSEGYSTTINCENGKRIPNGRDDNSIPLPLNLQNKLYFAAKKVQKYFRFPQDVEFLISEEDKRLYIIQSRPITAFSFSPDKIRANEQMKLSEILKENLNLYQKEPILSSTNISELFGQAVPLGYSIFKYGFAGTLELEGGISLGRSRLGYAKLDLEDQTKFFYTVADQAMTNLIVDALTFRLPGIDKNEYLKRFISYYLGKIKQEPSAASYPEDGLYLQNDQLEQWEEIAGERGAIFRKEYVQFLNKLIDYHVPKEYQNAGDFFKRNEEFYRSYLNCDLHSAGETILKLKIEDILKYFRTYFCPQYVVIARLAFLSTHLAKQKLSNLLISETATSIEDILNKLLRSVNIEDTLMRPDYPYFEQLLITGKITRKKFLDLFQHIGSLDIQQKRLGEYSHNELQSILGQSKNNGYGDGSLQTNDISMEFDEEILALYLKNKVFQILYTNAGKFMHLRERAKFELLKVLYVFKRTVIEIARIHRFGDLIYYLEHNEILKLNKKNRDNLRLIALQRKAYFEACGQYQVKKVIIDFESTPLEKKTVDRKLDSEEHYKFILGKSIFYGHAKGVCLTAKNNDEYLKKLTVYREKGIKEIIGVFTGVELSYLNLSALAGFTTENGGYLSHAATIARELRKPYITGIKLDQFQDGDYLILDTENEQVIYGKNVTN